MKPDPQIQPDKYRRIDFEDALTKRLCIIISKNVDGDYSHPATQLAWEGWKLAIDMMEAETKWQPIETAPKDGTSIDIWVGDFRWTNVHWREISANLNGWADEDGFFLGINPTHWLPLPVPPTDEVK